MDREVCGVCGAWKGDDELIALRQDLAAARALLREARDKVEWIGCSGEGYGAMIAMRDEFIVRIDAALAGERKE